MTRPSASKTAARPIRLPTREIKTLAKKLAQRLYQYGLPKPGRVTAQEYLVLTNVLGGEVEVEVLLTGTPGRNRDPFSNELLNGGFLKRRPEGPVIRVFVNPHLDPRTFEMRPRRIVEDELYRLLAHELTHAADIWSGKGSVGDLSGSMDDLKKHHHNHPSEVRALMRDVVSNLDDGDTVREFMGYGMDFNMALREALKDTKWPDIEPYLTPRNKKTILKGVYTFLQDQGLDDVPSAIRIATRLHSVYRVAARYKNKREVPKADGSGTTTVYEYSSRQVQHRNREKAKRVESLRQSIGDLRRQVKGDLDNQDPKTRLTALAIALIDETYERVGNDRSANDGHYGVTGWKVDHISFRSGSATLTYVGKSGVEHKKTVRDGKVVKALRAAVKGKDKDKVILCEGDECRVTSRDVNAYLKPFGVTAKDIRGLHANEEMRAELKKVRRNGGKLLDGKKEREKQLKEEFKKALEVAASAVGHNASTLKSQYLVPGLEASYIKDGTIPDALSKSASDFDAQRTLLMDTWLRQATKSRTEKEDEAAESLIRKQPKKKPPRKDLHKKRVDDPDTEADPDKEQDRKDTSHNWKDIGASWRELERRMAREFDTKEQLKQYLEDHPNADPKNHSVKTQEGEGEAEEDEPASEDAAPASEEPKKPKKPKLIDEKALATATENALNISEDAAALVEFRMEEGGLPKQLEKLLGRKVPRNKMIPIAQELSAALKEKQPELAGALETSIEIAELYNDRLEMRQQETPEERKKRVQAEEVAVQEYAKEMFEAYKAENPDTELTPADLEETVRDMADGYYKQINFEDVDGVKTLVPTQDDSGMTDREKKVRDEQKAEKMKRLEEEVKEKRIEEGLKETVKAVEGILEENRYGDKELGDEYKERISERLGKMKPAERKEFLSAMTETLQDLQADIPAGKAAIKDGRKALSADYANLSPQEAGKALAGAFYAERVTFNPFMLGQRAVSDETNPSDDDRIEEEQEAMQKRSLEAKKFYSGMDAKERAQALETIANTMQQEDLDPESPRSREMTAIRDGILLASIVKGDDVESVSEPFAKLAGYLSRTGQEDILLGGMDKLTSEEGQNVIRDTFEILTDKELLDFVEGSPLEPLAAVLTERNARGNKVLSTAEAAEMRKLLVDQLVEEIAFLDPLVGDYLDANGKPNLQKQRAQRIERARKKALKKVVPEVKKELKGRESEDVDMYADRPATEDFKKRLEQMSQDVRKEVTEELEREFDKTPDTDNVAVARTVVQEGTDKAIRQRKVTRGQRKKPKTQTESERRQKENQKEKARKKRKDVRRQKQKTRRKQKKAEEILLHQYDLNPWPDFSGHG